MNPNLKFRAWDHKLKQFEYFNITTALPIYSVESEFSIQRPTEVFDRYNNMIYEGDIVKAGAITSEVVYVGTSFNITDWELSFANYLLAGDIKVVGNIFQNNIEEIV
jgi:hypothetical protein